MQSHKYQVTGRQVIGIELLPPNVKAAIGLTPVTRAVALVNAQQLQTFAFIRDEWIHADVVLASLPAAMPCGYFSTTVHMNASGQRGYTAELADLAALK